MPFGAHWNPRPKQACCIPAADWFLEAGMRGWNSTKGGYRVEKAEVAFGCETLILCTDPWIVDALPALKNHATPYRQVLH